MKPEKLFNRQKVRSFPLRERKNLIDIQSFAGVEHTSVQLPSKLGFRVQQLADQIIRAREQGAAVVCAFGAHTIKNGLGQLLGRYAQEGWFTHLATNGAGIIHDWEFAFQGKSSEDVQKNVARGCFGTWEETGLYINLALAVGAFEGLGYGESVGSLISRDGLDIPSHDQLREILADTSADLWQAAAAADLLELLISEDIPSGWLSVQHPYKHLSMQALAYECGTVCSGHPMFGHDIIYTHRANRGAAVGRTAERDFSAFVQSVSRLEEGVYLSVGSAVMSPMIFEKALSMARNVAMQQGQTITNTTLLVADLQEEDWDWSQGEPPKDHPAYYQRFMKTFHRMGCKDAYMCIDNRDLLIALYRELEKRR